MNIYLSQGRKQFALNQSGADIFKNKFAQECNSVRRTSRRVELEFTRELAYPGAPFPATFEQLIAVPVHSWHHHHDLKFVVTPREWPAELRSRTLKL